MKKQRNEKIEYNGKNISLENMHHFSNLFLKFLIGRNFEFKVSMSHFSLSINLQPFVIFDTIIHGEIGLKYLLKI